MALAAEATVLNPVKRQAALERGKALVAPKEMAPVAVDPFHPQAFAEAVAGAGRVSAGTNPPPGTGGDTGSPPAGPRTERDLLQAIAKSLKPSGYIVLGGQPSISFGQKRVKPGGILTITFEGNQYTLEVVSIDRTNFTLRLNREEFTRTIK
ncbi:MAG: hypothetical protein HYX71_11225 [Opitutae bacterium]|nr:hypothetical protein [Opitutae bacterium]